MTKRGLMVVCAALGGAAVAADGNVRRLEPDGTNDMTRAVRDAIAAVTAQAARGARVVLAQGVYHFYAESAEEMMFYISNHDQPLPRRVQVPVCGVEDFTLCGEGDGAKLVFHGVSTGFLVCDSSRVTLRNVSLDWLSPPIGEARIVSRAADGRPVLDWIVRAQGDPHEAQMLWDGATHAIKPGTGDVFSMAQAAVGDVISFRDYARPAPAICLYRARGTVLDDVRIHAAYGMGLLAQRSTDVTWRGGGVYPREGCFCSTCADATHFSNCKGEISVTRAHFAGMMDDAINVHSTCLMIEAKTGARSFRCRYMHPQAIGFEVFAPGERLRFIRAHTLENGPVANVVRVKPLDARTVELELDEAGARALADYDAGDAVENADWQPSVVFCGNTVRNNRARAALFTTPGRVVVRDNVFERVSGTAILFAGDASNWYESGACEDVEISGNVFRDCLTSRYQFCNAVITSAPSVDNPALQKTPYHRNIRIIGNTFDCPGAKLWDGVSVADVVWRDNTGPVAADAQK